MSNEAPNAATSESLPSEAAAPAAAAEALASDQTAAVVAVNEGPPIRPSASEAAFDVAQLPQHARNLLKIKVTVAVDLAHQRRPIHEIIELSPGTLVKFDKTYDEPLELTVDGLPIARGEVVKVGDKFGLRIGKIVRS